ncbi:GntR family transcriptional regulator [Agromyces kandeliae]|uniref:FCD domain-containing protein n=1 Tax=Agromyces kandeliae TaxID=2666141 RepID=A0A6L5R4X3_9MICO|nr:GntR family transcriptional regulator [Agromyces kandeliae]MRX45136.1 FCD domain-containing protein [Agromyces kandeliae]
MADTSPLIEVASLREQVERAIASRIVAGEVEPGDVLTVPTMASEFGVSATPVREAMLDLARRGFLAPMRNRGFRVTEVSLDELRQLREVRRLLEVPPMRELAGRVPEEAAARLTDLAAEIVRAGDEGRFQDYLEADTTFHLTLLGLTGNRYLVDVVRELRQQTRLTGLAELAETGALTESALEHAELVRLLVDGRGDAAADLMSRHIGHVGGIWSGEHED